MVLGVVCACEALYARDFLCCLFITISGTIARIESRVSGAMRERGDVARFKRSLVEYTNGGTTDRVVRVWNRVNKGG
jgi:hypothetical protein